MYGFCNVWCFGNICTCIYCFVLFVRCFLYCLIYVHLWNGTNIYIYIYMCVCVCVCVCVCIVSCGFGNLHRICTYLQHLYFPEESSVFQPKYLGAIKPSLQLVGDKRMYVVLLCIHCGYENKQRLFPYTTLTVSFL